MVWAKYFSCEVSDRLGQNWIDHFLQLPIFLQVAAFRAFKIRARQMAVLRILKVKQDPLETLPALFESMQNAGPLPTRNVPKGHHVGIKVRLSLMIWDTSKS